MSRGREDISMDLVKLLFVIRIRFSNAWYCQRYTKTKQLFSPDDKQAIFKNRKRDKQAEPTNPWTGYYYTDTEGQSVC